MLVIGAGLVGTEVGARLRALGHEVACTTTTPGKVDGLREQFDEVLVLRGSDRDAVRAAMAGRDAVVVAAGPSAQRAMTPEDRAASYREILVDTAESVMSAGVDDAGDAPYVVALSSLSVYGNASDHLPEVTEDSPVTDSTDPSPTMFLAMEKVYLDGTDDRAVVFRCGDIFGAEDPPSRPRSRWPTSTSAARCRSAPTRCSTGSRSRTPPTRSCTPSRPGSPASTT